MGVSIPDVATIFTASQLVVVDETQRFNRVAGLDYYDFLEAICRVSILV